MNVLIVLTAVSTLCLADPKISSALEEEIIKELLHVINKNMTIPSNHSARTRDSDVTDAPNVMTTYSLVYA